MTNMTTMLGRMLTHDTGHINSDINDGVTTTTTTTTTTVTIVRLGGDMHWIIVGILIGLVCILSGVLMYLLYPPIRNYIRRKIPVNPEKIQRRYQTIDGWMVTKTVRPHSEDHCSACASALPTENRECLICMEPFQVDEQVSWSANVECEHVFHHSCIREWLLKHKECPCCRRLCLSIDGEDRNLLKEKLRELFRQTNQRRRETDYCLDHGRVESQRLERKRKMRLLQAAMEVSIAESKHADAQQDLEMAGEEALKNEDPPLTCEEPLATIMDEQDNSHDETPSTTVGTNVESDVEDAANHMQGNDDDILPSQIGGEMEMSPADAADSNSSNHVREVVLEVLDAPNANAMNIGVVEAPFGVLDASSANVMDIGVASDMACSLVVAQGSNDDATSMDM